MTFTLKSNSHLSLCLCDLVVHSLSLVVDVYPEKSCVLKLDRRRELSTDYRVNCPARSSAEEIPRIAILPIRNGPVYARVPEPLTRLPIADDHPDQPFVQKLPVETRVDLKPRARSGMFGDVG